MRDESTVFVVRETACSLVRATYGTNMKYAALTPKKIMNRNMLAAILHIAYSRRWIRRYSDIPQSQLVVVFLASPVPHLAKV